MELQRLSRLRTLRRTATRLADALVVGAGPAGIAAVGCLINAGLRVSWVDDGRFEGGALARYRDVPANTKVDVLQDLGGHEFLPGGLPIGSEAQAALDTMKATSHALNMEHDPAALGWTGLDSCHDFFTALTASLLSHERCDAVRGRVDALHTDAGYPKDGKAIWRARLAGSASDVFELGAPAVVIATGAEQMPTPAELQPSSWACEAAAQPRVLPVEQALQLTKLREMVQAHETVGVVGGGHTGLVVAMHLSESIGIRSTRLYVRRPIRLAQWDPAAKGYAAWGFRGLKGKAASFAIERGIVGMEPAAAPSPPARSPPTIELLDARKLRSCAATASGLDAVVYCLGFGAPPLPHVVRGAAPVSIAKHQSPGGALIDASGRRLCGLFGLGLGFSDSEFSSGRAYAEAGFMPFAVRAKEIADRVVQRLS